MQCSSSTVVVVSLAEREARAAAFAEIQPEHLLAAALKLAELSQIEIQRLASDQAASAAMTSEIGQLVSMLRDRGIDSTAVRRRIRSRLGSGGCPSGNGPLHRSAAARAVFDRAAALAMLDDTDTVTAAHLLASLLSEPTPVMREALGSAAVGQPVSQQASQQVSQQASQQRDQDVAPQRLDDLTERLRRLRDLLREKVFGQDHAVQAFVEGLFNAEVVVAADRDRRRPRSVFVFAGPPGVGKTLLAELGATCLERPFKRFDMSAYSGHEQEQDLVGWAPGYRGAKPGQLTEFVQKNPHCLLLFDEIEKAHVHTIQLFLQVLDAGRLEDKFTQEPVSFRDTTIIFTTNAGRKLYDRPNASGLHGANAAFHRRTILDALENEKDPHTGEPFFPAAICSRMATGYPVLFNHLGVNELERVARAELERVAGLLQAQYQKAVTFDDHIPLCLVLREGARCDARTLSAQAGAFLKGEVFKFCQLYKPERLENAFGGVDSVHVALEEELLDASPGIAEIFAPTTQSRVLLVGSPPLAALYRDTIDGIQWCTAATPEDAMELLAQHDVDLVLLDLYLGASRADLDRTIRQFDHAPAASRALGSGQELLRKIHERLPSLPVYLLSFENAGGQENGAGPVDEELFLACVRGGGARGLVRTNFISRGSADWQAARQNLAEQLSAVCRRLMREKTVARLGQERQVLTFETAPQIEPEKRRLTIRARGLRLTRALAAADAGEVVDDVERPSTRFENVIGADEAKKELRFFIDFLKAPKRFSALGLKPPKGVLLYGPPGTGKTMLARAMAGESDVAFLSASASSFVTIWQGSGPQNIRDLFARARRYAPAVIFIDEIDAIGKTRTGGAGASQAAENTLNALLTEMDGFTSPSPERPVFVLAATNFSLEDEEHATQSRASRTLDPALVRRFARAILVDLPDRAAREKYLFLRVADRPGCQVDPQFLRLIAERSAGMSIANLEAIVETAAREAVKADGSLTGKLLEEAFEMVRFGESRPCDPETVRRTAAHEAGHTILYWNAGWWPAYVTVVSRGEHGGYMAPSADEVERRASRTKADLLARIRVSLAGRAAEIMAYGPEAGLSTGASADLERATSIARQMVCRYGMDDQFGLLAATELLVSEAALGSPAYDQVNQAARAILQSEMDRTAALLEQHREPWRAVADALVARERLTAEDLQAILH